MLSNRYARCVVVLAAILAAAGCASARPFIAPNFAASQPAVTGDLIYATASDGKSIDIFSYPEGKLVLKFAPPEGTIALAGLCSNKAGDVWVTALSKPVTKSAIIEGHVYLYARGANRILKTLTFERSRPFGCSVDPASGTLAVSTVSAASGGTSTLETFTPGSYGGRSYYSSNIDNYYYCAYDDGGNLFVSGQGTGTEMYLDELPKGAQGLSELKLDRYVSVSGMGQLQWSGGNLTLEDLTAGAIYRLRKSRSSVAFVGKTALTGWTGSGLSVIEGTTVMVPSGVSGTSIGFWKYPSGGQKMKSVASPNGLFALTVSNAGMR